MNLNQIILTALANLNLPCVPDHYTGTEQVYVTFNYNLLPTSYSDDKPKFWNALIQVHLYAPIGKNVLSTRMEIPKLLVLADLAWPTVEDAGDNAVQHFVFETETLIPLEVVEDGSV